MPLLGVSRRRAAALGPPSSLEDDDPVPCRPVALTLRQAEIDGAGHREAGCPSQPHAGRLSRLPGIGIVRTKSQQKPLPAANRLINLPPRTLGGSSRLLDLRGLRSAWSLGSQPLTWQPSPHHHLVTVQRTPFNTQACVLTQDKAKGGVSDVSPLLPTPAPQEHAFGQHLWEGRERVNPQASRRL